MEKEKKKYRLFWLFVKVQIVLLAFVAAGLLYYFFGGYGKEIRGMREEAHRLVRDSTPDTFRTNQTSIVYDASGAVISTLKGAGESYYLPMEDIPAEAAAAIISIEDKKFYRHKGVDYKGMLRAVWSVVKSREATQGGSTITMQLARNIFLTQEKTWQRKAEEIFIAWDLEKKYTKDEILEFYLNNIYFGNGYYGLQSASRGYFNRDAEDLDLSELCFLCAVPNNPTLYDPIKNKENTIKRRDRILSNMLDDGKISSVDYAKAVVEQITLERPEAVQRYDYIETYTYYCAARALMENEDFRFRYEFDTREAEEIYDTAYEMMYAECQKKLYTSGYRIYTSLDLTLQDELQSAVDDTLAGFTEETEDGVYMLQASSVCIDNETGYVKAIVGGRGQEFSGNTLNRAYQSFRQPGSAIKPLTVYTPSFERGYTPSSIVVDEPIEDGPKNANRRYAGSITLRTAVEQSINTIAWKLYAELTPEQGLSYLREMNFSRLDPEDYRLATALGGFTNGVSALEMASGYAALINDGGFRAPTCIVKILDADGNEIYAPGREEKQVYKQNAARMMTDVLSGVMTRGTGKGLGLGAMPSAGKTGTTNDHKDGWIVGYTRYYTTSVWVGYDMPKTMDGLMGATYPGKIWKTFMEKAHEGLEPLGFLPYAGKETEAGAKWLEEPEEEKADETLQEETPQYEEPEYTEPAPEGGGEPSAGENNTVSGEENGAGDGTVPGEGNGMTPGAGNGTVPGEGSGSAPGAGNGSSPEEGAQPLPGGDEAGQDAPGQTPPDAPVTQEVQGQTSPDAR